MPDNIDPEKLAAFEKAARLAAGLPELPGPVENPPAEDQEPDIVTEAARAAAGLPSTIPVESTGQG